MRKSDFVLKIKYVAYSMNIFQVEDCILCGDTRVPCQPLINGSTEGEDGHLAVLHEGDYSTNVMHFYSTLKSSVESLILSLVVVFPP
jgi:hypothetical protein